MFSSAEDNPAGCAYLVSLEKGLARPGFEVQQRRNCSHVGSFEHYLKRDHQKEWSDGKNGFG